MTRTTGQKSLAPWLWALALAWAGTCPGAGLIVTVDLGPERAERLRALPEDTLEQRPKSTFTAAVTVSGEAGEGQEAPSAPCEEEEQQRTFTWSWDQSTAECIAGGGPQDNTLTVRYLPGQDGAMTVTAAVQVACGELSGDGTDSVLVVVPTWQPDLGIAPGAAGDAGSSSGEAAAPAGAPAAPEGAPHAITVPPDQALVLPCTVVALAGAAHDPKDKRVGKETTETTPVPILPSWYAPACGSLAGGILDAAGRRLGPGVTWTAPPPPTAPPLPESVGVADILLRADFVDTTELAQPRENGTSIDPLLADAVTVHVPAAAIAVDSCCRPWASAETVTLTWVLGPAGLPGLGGSGSVALTHAPPGEEALVPMLLATFVVVDGVSRLSAAGEPNAISFWHPWHADGTPVAPGQYVFTLSWDASLNGGPSVQVVSTATLTIYRVQIADADGTLPAERTVVCVGKTAPFRAVVTPPAPGVFLWSTADPLKLTVAAEGPLATVSGQKESASVRDVTLDVIFHPDSCPGIAAASSQAMTVAAVEIRSHAGNDPHTVICVDTPTAYLARSKPPGLPGTFAWTAVTDYGRLVIVTQNPATGEAWCHGGVYHSTTKDAEKLQVVFVPQGLATADAAQAELAITIAAVRIRADNGQAPSPLIGAGQTLRFRAESQPDGVGGGCSWSTPSADLQLAPAGSSVNVTAADPLSERD